MTSKPKIWNAQNPVNDCGIKKYIGLGKNA